MGRTQRQSKKQGESKMNTEPKISLDDCLKYALKNNLTGNNPHRPWTVTECPECRSVWDESDLYCDSCHCPLYNDTHIRTEIKQHQSMIMYEKQQREYKQND